MDNRSEKSNLRYKCILFDISIEIKLVESNAHISGKRRPFCLNLDYIN